MASSGCLRAWLGVVLVCMTAGGSLLLPLGLDTISAPAPGGDFRDVLSPALFFGLAFLAGVLACAEAVVLVVRQRSMPRVCFVAALGAHLLAIAGLTFVTARGLGWL